MKGKVCGVRKNKSRDISGKMSGKPYGNLVINLLVMLLAVWLMACGLGDGAGETTSLEENAARPYFGRDCIFYHGQLYWNNGVWFSTESDAQNLLPTEHYEEGQISRCVKAMPQAEGEAALLPEGTDFLYHEAMDAIFVKKEAGYVQYIPMPGMKEVVEEMIAMDPTGISPGYEYMGAPLIFYEGHLYHSSATFYEQEQVGTLHQLGRIQCRCDAVPAEHLHSSSLEAGTVVYQGSIYPDGLVVYREQTKEYQLYRIYENAE